MTYLDRAIKDGYAIITGPENKQKIIYVTSDNHTENYNDPEEKVRAEFWAELIYEYDYPAHRIKVEVTIPDRVPTDRADIVIFSDDECKKPYAVVECKRDGVTDAEFLQAIEQGVGNATWVKLRASYVVIIAGATRRVLDFSDDSTGILERENNIIADLPKAYGKPQAFRFYRGGEYTDVDGKKKKAPDIQPVAREDLITAIKKCHNTLWGGGRLSPPTAFGELCKLIFVKISDEQKPRKKGEPYQFQIKTHEPSSKLAERINALYNEQKVKDPEVFTDSIKVDDRVLRTVVSHLESINLNKTDLDVKGVAFEQFMDGFFKGDFGQYFTPRPIIEFAVKMMKPEHDWDVLDPACGSGGFLLHALDYMRSQASEYYDKDTVDYFNYWHDFASKHLYGIEINDEIARVAKMNMIVHDDGHTNVISFDALDSIDKMHDHNRGFEAGKFDLILTNPPFGSIFNRYVRSTEQTIFMSRCFSAEYNETENAIRRAINEINNEKKTGIMLIRVDEHHEGTTGQISDRIFRDIESAGLVIADLSSGKLNVPHEIGYAMGLKKDLILVHNGTSEEAEKHIPSNIRMFEQIRFNGDYQTLQNEIKRRLIDYYKL